MAVELRVKNTLDIDVHVYDALNGVRMANITAGGEEVFEGYKSQRLYALEANQTGLGRLLEDFYVDPSEGKAKKRLVIKESAVQMINEFNFYKEVIADESRDVLLEFYAPWCGFCTKLTPQYEELGRKYKDETSLLIAKCDFTANTKIKHPKVKISSFPTLFLFPKKLKKAPIQMEVKAFPLDFSGFLGKHLYTDEDDGNQEEEGWGDDETDSDMESAKDEL